MRIDPRTLLEIRNHSLLLDTLKIRAGALIGALAMQERYIAQATDPTMGTNNGVPHITDANMPDIKSCNADALRLAEFIRDHINRLETEL
tara:strand:+ start:9 stop:278 length:270 start_codon:yes stop_codon:yes gene_type:complete